MRTAFVIIAICFAVFIGTTFGFPMEFQKPAEPEEAVMVEEVLADGDAASKDGQEPSELSANEGRTSSRQGKQLLLPSAPMGLHPYGPAAAALAAHNRRPFLVGPVPMAAAPDARPYLRRLGGGGGGGASASGAEMRWFLNRNQLIDGIINALEILRGGFGGGSSSSSSQQQQAAAASANTSKRIHLASDDVNKALTIVGSPQSDQLVHVASSGNTDRLDMAAAGEAGGANQMSSGTNVNLNAASSSDPLAFELASIQALIDEANRNQQLQQSQQMGGSQQHGINIRPVGDSNDIYESQVILGHLAPERPAPALPGLTSFSSNLPQLQLPSVSQGLQSITNLLRLPIRVVNGWMVHQ